ncbi:C-myc promoter-binding isoform X1 [Brachionus plicatilis]|uniref:C-myc promoter-binding isoform X1 n=1 Tax=Brachionus plicatilis TaxID=10195 RepID=A0A3M7PIE4_BRAPC|nr:C-myc promoter-binding isoform X1 [Brachionus plicatilis]
MSNLNLNSMSNDNKRIFDYFIVTGLPPKLTAKSGVDSDQVLEKDQHRKLLLKNIEMDLYHANNEKKDPIVDIAIMKRTLNEGIPNGYECIWNTPSNNSANLCCEIVKKNEMYLLIRRGYDKPPIADIGVYYEGIETVREGCTIIKETIGNNSANLNTSSLNAKRVFITYRRLTDLACNCLAMIDVCVINKGQGEKAPHTFNEIPKNLNVGFLGPSMALCYKKSWIPAPQIKYSPSILYRYPQTDHSDLPFPSEMAYFGLPMGATIESWPKTNIQSPKNVSLSDLKPVFSTFVLNVNSEDGSIVEKVYGSVITFYEDFDQNCLNEDQCEMLKFNNSNQSRTLHSNKSLVILSRHPIFETYKSFLFFLFNKYTKKVNIKSSEDLIIPIERYLSYLIFEVPFPTAKKSRVLVHLTDWDTDNLTVNLPSEIVLPQSGASFADLLYNLKVENSINVFLFAILQKNLMIHSLRRCVLTSVVEAISSIIFPFVWRYSYLPMCPLSLCQLTEAPGSFIIGMDTRFFDYFDLPHNVICVDLDTNTISWTEDRRTINPNILPKNIKNSLKDRLEKILEGITKLYIEKNSIQEPTKNQETDFKKRLRNFELSIREAFLKAMACFLSDYKTFLRTATRRPDLKAKDRNIIKYFDTGKFLESKQSSEKLFYQELIRTQLFYDCIMNLSFTSELDPALAQSFMVFSDICSKMNPNSYRDDEIKLISLNNSNDSQTIVMLPPQLDAEFLNHLNPILTNMDPKDIIINGSAFIYDDKENSFPKLKIEVYSNYNSNTNSSLDLDASIGSKNDHLLIEDLRKNSLKLSDSNRIETQSNSSSITQNFSRKSNKMLSTPMGIRTKAEKIQALKRMESKISFKSTNSIKQAQKNYNTLAKFHAHCFLSNAYALWFIYLPEYIKECEDLKKNALDYAYMVLTQMQKHNLNHPDEVC